MKKIALLLGLLLMPLSLTSCNGEVSNDLFTYESTNFTPIIKDGVNSEHQDYDGIKVNPLTNSLRKDFAYGVDASMINDVESNGGKYFNKNGQEQDVFQILSNSGVNFLRLRLWNSPISVKGDTYGGGGNTKEVDLALAKRARNAGMNVLIDFHYSDFWADPNSQVQPKAWAMISKSKTAQEVETYTKDTLQYFSDNGVKVDAVQIGNEINNGMIYPKCKINWSDEQTSFDNLASVISAGIKGAKSVFPNVRSIVHLANGGGYDEFTAFFSNLEERKVDYDIIGASYYPYYHGTLDALQKNLDHISQMTNKPVIIAEMSYGFTDDSNEYTANIYSSSMEQKGGFLTSQQGQASAIRDVLDVLSKVPSSLGAGMFYWEPAWLPIKGAMWASAVGQSYLDYEDETHALLYSDGLSTWSNQGWFSYSGKLLASGNVYKILKDKDLTHSLEEKTVEVKEPQFDYLINIALSETLPSTVQCITNLDSIKDRPVVWNQDDLSKLTKVGIYVVHGLVDGAYEVTANCNCVENFVQDPGYELQDKTSDALVSPWFIKDQTPENQKVCKLDRKTDTRTGTTDMNWYYTTAFSFTAYQNISGVGKGTYALTTYVLSPSKQESPCNDSIVIYAKINDQTYTIDMSDLVLGWNSGYQIAYLPNIEVTNDNSTIEIGVNVVAQAKSWGHIDDWLLAKM